MERQQLFEETTFAKPQIPTLETVIARNDYIKQDIHVLNFYCHVDQIIVKRPFNLPSLRLDYNQPNPKVGIGVCQFSKDGNYLASRNGKLQAYSVIQSFMLIIKHQIIYQPRYGFGM